MDNGIPKTFQTNDPLRVIFSRQCVSGEQQTAEGSCTKCEQSTYLLEPPDRVMPCKPCPANSFCYGTNKIAPKPGNFRNSLKNDSIPCQAKEACLGGNRTNLLGTCDVGYRGTLCGDCAPNYYKASWKVCQGCPPIEATLLQQLVRITCIISFISLCVWLNTSIAKHYDA